MTPRLYYKDKQVEIWHGDCRDVLPTLAKADLILTDPPYGIKSVHRNGTLGGRRTAVSARSRKYRPVINDDRLYHPRWLMGYASRVIVWGAEHMTMGIPLRGRLLVWNKRTDQESIDQPDGEAAWDSKAGPLRIFNHRQGRTVSDYGDIERVHPNQKLLALMAWCLSLAPEAQYIVDPFTGSGTTLVAALQAGRSKVIGVELDEEYCEVAAKRCDTQLSK